MLVLWTWSNSTDTEVIGPSRAPVMLPNPVLNSYAYSCKFVLLSFLIREASNCTRYWLILLKLLRLRNHLLQKMGRLYQHPPLRLGITLKKDQKECQSEWIYDVCTRASLLGRSRLHNKQKEDMKAGKLCVGRDGKDLKGGNGGRYDYDSCIHMQNY